MTDQWDEGCIYLDFYYIEKQRIHGSSNIPFVVCPMDPMFGSDRPSGCKWLSTNLVSYMNKPQQIYRGYLEDHLT